jgi:hypothetical protein
MNSKRHFEIQTKVATIYMEDMHPSANKYPDIIENQFQLRKNDTFTGENVVAIANMGEAIWWNRPLKENTDAAWGWQGDIPCCNLPITLGKNMQWKSYYNLLLNKHNLPTIVQIKFNHTLSQDELEKLGLMSHTVITQTLLRLGVPEQDMCVINNDFLLKGKKFSGGETVIKADIYTECFLITLRYQEEKEIFDQLSSGKVPATAHRGITGIIDEYPHITKEDFVKIYCEEFKKYLDQFEL